MVKIVWTELSILDLKELFDYIAEDSNRYATLTVNRLYNRVQPISENPYMGRIVPEFNEKPIREILDGHYRIIYKIKSKNQIDILRVYHGARLLKKKNLR